MWKLVLNKTQRHLVAKLLKLVIGALKSSRRILTTFAVDREVKTFYIVRYMLKQNKSLHFKSLLTSVRPFLEVPQYQADNSLEGVLSLNSFLMCWCM